MNLEDLIQLLNSFPIRSITSVYIRYEDSEGNDRNIDIKIDD